MHTTQLLDTLREAGPDRGCWTWWGDTEAPETSGAAVRHQVLALYDRIPLETLEIGGDRRVVDLPRAWDLEP